MNLTFYENLALLELYEYNFFHFWRSVLELFAMSGSTHALSGVTPTFL